jgi:hypothetical protein
MNPAVNLSTDDLPAIFDLCEIPIHPNMEIILKLVKNEVESLEEAQDLLHTFKKAVAAARRSTNKKYHPDIHSAQGTTPKKDISEINGWLDLFNTFRISNVRKNPSATDFWSTTSWENHWKTYTYYSNSV